MPHVGMRGCVSESLYAYIKGRHLIAVGPRTARTLHIGVHKVGVKARGV